MRLFFDSNELTYIALFEGYICEGTESEFDAAKKTWAALQRYEPDAGFLKAAASANTGVTVARVSELPFIREGA